MSTEEQQAIEQFAAELSEFRRDCGAPSFRRLSVLAKEAGHSRLAPSTACDATRGKRLPAIEVVIHFVTACRRAAEEVGISLDDDPRLRPTWWQARWTATCRARHRAKIRPVASGSAMPSGPATAPNPSEGGPSASDPVAPRGPASKSPMQPQTLRSWTPELMWLPNVERSRYLIIADAGGMQVPALASGTRVAAGPEVPGLPGVVHDVDELCESLSRCAPWLTVEILANPLLAQAAAVLEAAAREVDDVLIVHVLGHGYLDDEMALYLVVQDTDMQRFPRSALPLTQTISRLRNLSRAKAIVVVIDTCFAGAAIPQSLAADSGDLFILAASSADGLAYDRPFSLTGWFAAVLRAGIHEFPYPMLPLGLVADETARAVARQPSHPREQKVTVFNQGDADKLALGINSRTPRGDVVAAR
ncbi:hypothetical protein [Nocardia jiangsuensis]|uniref:Caspase domain-containing protein n=1 Tax=Nocardia jiangsuensis TaxID=1691563 RepID=A0ABV8DPU2_9NOCA